MEFKIRLNNRKLSLQVLLLLASLTAIAQDGILDTAFGVNGFTKTDVNNHYDTFYALTVQNDGKIIGVGNITTGTDANGVSMIVRYNENGGLDTTFGNNGKVIADFSPQFEQLNAVKVQADGKIVVAGYAGLDFLIARYTANGQLDSSFGTDGVVFTDYYSTIVGSSQDKINCIAIQSDGKIVVGGIAKYYGNHPYALARYNANGTLDNSFGLGGKTIIGHNFNLSSGIKEIFDIAITPTGKIYAVGKTTQHSSDSYGDQTIVRFNSDGSMDTTFAVSGVRYFDSGTADSTFTDIELQADGKLVISGNRSVTINVSRLSENGVLDTTFGTTGRVSPNLLSLLGAGASFNKSVCIQPDGKIILSGNINATGGYQTVLLRYLPDGTLDTTFSNDGIATFFVGDEYQGGSFAALQPNGKLIVGGDYNDSNIANTDLYLFRVTASALSTADFSDSKITSYPNPVKDKLFIQRTPGDYDANYKLFSMDGKQIKTVVLNPSEDIFQIDVSQLVRGVYILATENGYSKKIIKE